MKGLGLVRSADLDQKKLKRNTKVNIEPDMTAEAKVLHPIDLDHAINVNVLKIERRDNMKEAEKEIDTDQDHTETEIKISTSSIRYRQHRLRC